MSVLLGGQVFLNEMGYTTGRLLKSESLECDFVFDVGLVSAKYIVFRFYHVQSLQMN